MVQENYNLKDEGGKSMRHIPLAKPHFSDEEVDAVRKTLESGWVAQGPRVKEFEKKITEYSGAKHGVAVNSCTSGLHLALLAHGISEGDKVIVPDYTFTATGNVILHVGAEPVLTDIEMDTFCMDIGEIEEKIDETVKAIMPVHTFGHPADMQKLNRIARKHGLNVIEEAASGLGAEINKQKIGSFGNITCFSLQARKIITTGEGGMIVTDDNEAAEKLRALRSQGAYSPGQVTGLNLPIFRVLGFSYRMSDIQAAVGLIQLQKLEQFIDKRIYLANYYRDLLLDTKVDVTIPYVTKNARHTYQAYVILVKEKRDKIILNLRKNGIESTIGTYSLSSIPLFKRKEGVCINGSYAFKHSLALPMYHELTEEDIDYIVKKLKTCLND